MENEKVLELLDLCLKAKENGHDVFFSYSPHVKSVSIGIHTNGWLRGADSDVSETFYTDCMCQEKNRDKYLSILAYLKELI
ncbi:MAG: hypothetical protein K0S76_477 [Herbinix sp.]|jgi:hypothetical protein|nr:hypothetical protein [Herbinix sp.]